MSGFYAKLLDKSTYPILGITFSFPLILILDMIIPFSTLFSISIETFYSLNVVLHLLIALFVVILVNQLGVLLAKVGNNLGVKSIILSLVGIFILMFHEPHDIEKMKLSKRKLISITTSGAIMNIFLLLITLPLFFAPTTVFYPIFIHSDGAIIVSSTIDQSTLSQNIVGEVILSVDRLDEFFLVKETVEIKSSNDFKSLSQQVIQNERVKVNFLSNNSVIVKASSTDRNSIIDLGILVDDYFKPRTTIFSPLIPYHILQINQWIYNLSIVFVVFNLLPISKSDGVELYNIFLQKKKVGKWPAIQISKLLSTILLLVYIFVKFL